MKIFSHSSSSFSVLTIFWGILLAKLLASFTFQKGDVLEAIGSTYFLKKNIQFSDIDRVGICWVSTVSCTSNCISRYTLFNVHMKLGKMLTHRSVSRIYKIDKFYKWKLLFTSSEFLQMKVTFHMTDEACSRYLFGLVSKTEWMMTTIFS